MEDFDFTLALHDEQLPVHIHPHEQGDKTYYDIFFEDHSISIYKDTLYTWTCDDSHGLSKDDMQSIGEQIDMRQQLHKNCGKTNLRLSCVFKKFIYI